VQTLFRQTLFFIGIFVELRLLIVRKKLSYLGIINNFVGIRGVSGIYTDNLVGSIGIDIIIEEIIFLLAIFGILSFGHVLFNSVMRKIPKYLHKL